EPSPKRRLFTSVPLSAIPASKVSSMKYSNRARRFSATVFTLSKVEGFGRAMMRGHVGRATGRWNPLSGTRVTCADRDRAARYPLLGGRKNGSPDQDDGWAREPGRAAGRAAHRRRRRLAAARSIRGTPCGRGCGHLAEREEDRR